MQSSSSYTIYNASAGSGKTYSLAKSYLKIILSSKNPELFRSLLAITFTNKAVFEMKNRIIEYLTLFSDEKSLSEPDTMFDELCKELKLAPMELKMRSEDILKHILHNYASFNISTIDGFNHQLIRSFAFDLRLNQFFEVQLDAKTLLQRAVDNLLNLAGTDDELTNLLTEFSNDKIKEDKNWDISNELFRVANMLTNENHYWQLNTLKKKDLEDFKALKRNLFKKKNESISIIKETAVAFLNLLDENNLDKSAFKGGYAYNFFENLNENPEKEPAWGAAWQENLASEPLYAKTNVKNLNTDLIDSLQSQIFSYFSVIKEAFGLFNFSKNALQFVVPLALLNRIQNEIELIKDEENILPIWEFNGVISSEISSQPAPFIYERIGERYRHYFIDEFQDTSVLQWKNLIPLILNAVQSENITKQKGSLLLVGDAKQSIYRWRGGKTEQFMSLYSNEENPFFIKGQTINLEDNYRSLETIINFNNHFFSFIADKFESEKYKALYLNAMQNYPESKRNKFLPEGYLSIQFVNLDITDSSEDFEEIPSEESSLFDIFTEREITYCNAIFEAINHANQSGAEDKDITILVRTNKEGAAVASFLSSKGRNVISPDSLLLKNIASIQFLISLLHLLYNKNSQELKVKMLFEFVGLKGIEQVHQFITKYIEEPIETFFNDHNFSVSKFHSHSLYEGITLIINCFDLSRKSDAYLTHFLDLIFDFKNTHKGGLAEFLIFWEEEKEKLSISLPEGLNAITVMTVHKSKGLSAPVIIYAFADSKLIESRNQTIWYPVSNKDFSGFDTLLVETNKSLINFEPQTEEIIRQHHEQHLLDQINVLYVAMTRPESFLYVITSLPKAATKKNSKSDTKTETYGSLFKSFIEMKGQWNDDFLRYEFGNPVFPIKEKKQTSTTEGLIDFQKGWTTPNYKIATGASLLWDTARKESIEKGNLMHELLAKVVYHSDLESVLKNALAEGMLTDEQYKIVLEQLLKLIQDEKISEFFSENYTYFIEREFIDKSGKFFRPDRIAFNPKSKQAVIIDYKTGKPNDKHHLQMRNYAHILSDLGWKVIGKYLIYLDEEKIVKS
ncbi:UvrD-helicase domain-containing protein [Capnocytophaga cynodegmi]|uniref:UvrD-helicase domain-containing protein n=1 Tax=Capnocytophaga cynodegmi TaxID=28189 RepID=UPI001AD5280F|nr:UvrD-helicase domain-containing protein [Capnocytophaga cynodegmi]GIM55146.1 ATP-dependent helicase [Capnocytophaga cynodegmi]